MRVLPSILQNYINQMSSNELVNRKSRFTDRQYENSSIYNKSVKSELNSLSVDLPKHHKKYTNIEREILMKQGQTTNAIINLTSTKYPVLLEVCGHEGLNWKVENFQQSKNWHLKWYDTGVSNQILTRMSYNQKINHFPNMAVITRKNTLAITLGKMKEQFHEEYDFIPRTFLYPNDYAKIRNYFVQSRKRGLIKTFIVKPQSGCQGRGIYITQNPSDFQKEERCVIQKYIANPLLYQGLKFDLRIYVLLASCNPLRIYLYNEGLVRFATEKYELPDHKNLDNFFIHLTNYAINKSNPNYQYNYTVNDMSYGHKKSLAQFFKTLKELGYKANLYWSQIKDHIVKTIIAAQPFLLSNYKACRPLEPTHNMCFQLLGFDFLIDNQDRCLLLQVNHTPSFSTDTPLDHIIKKNLIRDTLLMMNPTPEELNIRDQLQRLKQREKYVKFKNSADNSALQRQQLVKMINELRQNHQLTFKGTYQMIYPCKNESKMQKYTDFLTFANKLLLHNHTNSTSSIPTVSDIRSKYRELPKTKTSSKQIIKQNISRNVVQNNKKRNIIYNYNIIKRDKKDVPAKRALLTLPSQPHRVQSTPKERFASSRNIRVMSKQKLKSQSLSRQPKIQEYPREQQPRSNMRSQQKKPLNEFIRSRQASIRVVSQQRSPQRQLSNFSNRIRAYRTPLMF